MWNKIREKLGLPSTGIGKATTVRNVNDVIISVQEGMSETRTIMITNWNPTDAFDLFKQVRDELRENHRDSTL